MIMTSCVINIYIYKRNRHIYIYTSEIRQKIPTLHCVHFADDSTVSASGDDIYIYIYIIVLCIYMIFRYFKQWVGVWSQANRLPLMQLKLLICLLRTIIFLITCSWRLVTLFWTEYKIKIYSVFQLTRSFLSKLTLTGLVGKYQYIFMNWYIMWVASLCFKRNPCQIVFCPNSLPLLLWYYS